MKSLIKNLKMKILKPLFFATASALFLASCGSGVAPIISTPIGNIDSQPLKVGDISENNLKTWSAADLVSDTIPGMSVNKAYAEILPALKGKGTNVIVAVIDSGVDIEHEDLKNVIWVNKGEIPNNGIDDDKNGFIDDIHGWNFLGDIVGENLEYTRIVRKYKGQFEGKTEASIGMENKAAFIMYEKAQADLTKNVAEAQANKTRYEQMLPPIKSAHKTISAKLGKEIYTTEDLKGITNPTEQEKKDIDILGGMLRYGDIPGLIDQLNSGIKHFNSQLENHLNVNKDYRTVLGDDPYDIKDNHYGNNDVDGPTPDKEDVMHGTHVAGIIAAQRGNGIGMDGVASNVEIMVVRAVPDGDEYDKDVALAIRYAVDNGAKVINTSFGKAYSQNPEWVWDAIKYAAKHDVLIVNAAGNDGIDLDIVSSYPNDITADGKDIGETFITIGALNYKYGSEMVATFSNYGTYNVDVFSPGVKIWSTTPLDTYKFLQGTSMASPNVAGVAAVIRSYFPKLSAKEVKKVLMDSGLSSSTSVVLGGEKSNVEPFNSISVSGKMVNLYNALIMASKM